MGTVSRLRCAGCGKFISGKVTGPCPKCGSTVRALHISETLNVHEALSFKSIRLRTEKNIWLIVASIVLLILSSGVGFYLAGVLGFVVGLAIGSFGSWISFLGVTRVREEREWQDR
jgi:hypothetical protein